MSLPPACLRSLSFISIGVVVGIACFFSIGCRTPGPQLQIYDPVADGEVLLSEALKAANQNGHRVLLNLGANWCSDSQKMYRLLREDPVIAPFVQTHYVLAVVDVNNRWGPQRNAALLDRLGVSLSKGIPVLLILDTDGHVMNSDPSKRLADSDHKRPRKVLRYLAKWASVRQ